MHSDPNTHVLLPPAMTAAPGQPPFVSVVIPALNCRQEVDDCILALRAQEFPQSRLEVIVADNGSTDGTVERARALGVTVVHMPQRGRSRALNAGLEAARGEFILTTDMGCAARPEWIRNVVRCFDDPQVGCVAGEIRMRPTGDNLALRYQRRHQYMSPLLALRRRQLPWLPFADGANASFRRAVFEEIGGFEASFYKSADVEICYRMLVLSDWKIVFCPECLMEESGEPDLKALLHQRYRMGQAKALMSARFPLFYAPTARNDGKAVPWKQHYWELRERARAVWRWTRAAATLDRPYLEDSLVTSLMVRSQLRGEREGVAYFAQQSVKPQPIDSAAARRFLSRIHQLDDRVQLRRIAPH